jgi:restriction endonuclease S subunit
MKDSNLKPSNHNYIGKIPYEWNIKKLKYVVQKLKSGGTPDSSNPDYYTDDDTGIKWLSIGDMSTNDFVYDTKNHITNNGVLVKNLNIFPAGTILYSIYATIGKVSELGTEAAINQAILAITPKKEMNKDYLKFSLKSLEDYAISLTSESTQKNLNANKVENFPIVFPPKDEQVLIASFLDQKCSNIDSIINDLEKQIGILEKYKKSVITEAVTKGLNPDVEMKDSGIKWIGNIPKHWDVSKVYRVCKIIRGNSAFQKDDLKNEGDYIGLQYGKTYKVNEVNDEYNYYVDSSFYKFNQVIISGYTIMVSTSETMEDLGHSCYYNRNDIGLLGGEQLALVPSEIFIGKFLYYASRYFKIELNQFASGIKVYRYKVSDLKNVNVIIPTLHEQTEIISFLDKKCAVIDSIIEDKKNQVESIKKYKNSLIYEYVTGKKRVSQGDVNE